MEAHGKSVKSDLIMRLGPMLRTAKNLIEGEKGRGWVFSQLFSAPRSFTPAASFPGRQLANSFARSFPHARRQAGFLPVSTHAALDRASVFLSQAGKKEFSRRSPRFFDHLAGLWRKFCLHGLGGWCAASQLANFPSLPAGFCGRPISPTKLSLLLLLPLRAHDSCFFARGSSWCKSGK